MNISPIPTPRRKLWQRPPLSYVVAVAGVALMTLLIEQTHSGGIANISMLYLLVVTVCALFLGRTAAVLCSVCSFFAFDYFFVEPRYQLTVQDPSEWLALCTFLLTATIIGQLTALLKSEAETARKASAHTAVLADASWLVASEMDKERVLKELIKRIADATGARQLGLMILTDQTEHENRTWLTTEGTQPIADVSEKAVQFAIANTRAINWEQNELWQKALSLEVEPTAIYLPVAFENTTLGLIYICLPAQVNLSENERNLISSLVNHAAVVLHRDRLIQVQLKAKALTEADRLKTALLSMVSHDFRSPLTSIKATVGSLMEDGVAIDEETRKSMLHAVEQETDRLNRMVGNILNLSKLEADAWRPLLEEIPITELIGSTLDAISQESNRRINVEIDPNVTEVLVDSVQITQVLTNLLENAIKYSAGEVDFKVSQQDAHVILEISDRGGGLRSGEEDQIFLPFYRATHLQESAIPGMGIGLAVCKGLVEAHNGSLTACNRDGGGAVFRVSLPMGSPQLEVIDVAKNTSH